MLRFARNDGNRPDRRAALALALAGLAAPAAAQQADDAHVVPEVLDFREKLRAAIEKKDAKALESFYAPRYAHWRDSGRFQPRDQRIADILAGEKLIETEEEQQVVIHAFGPVTAVATGQSRIAVAGRPVEFTWLVVYVKLAGRWQMAMATSNRLARG